MAADRKSKSKPNKSGRTAKKSASTKAAKSSTTKSKSQAKNKLKGSSQSASTAMSEFLRNKRIAASLSQADVAKELGYSSPQFISNWERGLVLPPLATLPQLLKLYNLNRNEVIDLLLQHTRNEIEQFLPNKKK